jgi:hypothetical protein
VVHPAAKTQAHVNKMLVEVSIVQMREGFEELARKRLQDAFEELETQRKRILAISRLPFYPLIRPMVKWFWRVTGTS